MKSYLIPWLSFLTISLCPLWAAGETIPDETCLECHDDKELTKDMPDGQKKSLLVDPAKLKPSVHGKTQCGETPG